MNEEAISYIMQKMSNCLDNSQMIRLEKTLEEALRGEDIVSLKPSEELLEEFLSVKRLEGRSEKTLFLYKFNIGKIKQILKERIEDGANEKAVLNSSITALSFASISIFPG